MGRCCTAVKKSRCPSSWAEVSSDGTEERERGAMLLMTSRPVTLHLVSSGALILEEYHSTLGLVRRFVGKALLRRLQAGGAWVNVNVLGSTKPNLEDF